MRFFLDSISSDTLRLGAGCYRCFGDTEQRVKSMLDKATIEFIQAHRYDDVRLLALQARKYPSVDMREAVVQIEGWQHACEKLPTWSATKGVVYHEI